MVNGGGLTDGNKNYNELQVMGMIGLSVMAQKPKKTSGNAKVTI